MGGELVSSAVSEGGDPERRGFVKLGARQGLRAPHLWPPATPSFEMQGKAPRAAKEHKGIHTDPHTVPGTRLPAQRSPAQREAWGVPPRPGTLQPPPHTTL